MNGDESKLFCCNLIEPGTVIEIKIIFWQLSKIIHHLLNIYLGTMNEYNALNTQPTAVMYRNSPDSRHMNRIEQSNILVAEDHIN